VTDLRSTAAALVGGLAAGGNVGRSSSGDGRESCGCEVRFEDDRLVLDADGCPGGGVLSSAPACRTSAVDALRDRDADAAVAVADGVERAYEGPGFALLVAAGRFVERVRPHDEQLAARCRTDPLAAGSAAAGRAGVVADIAAETGLAESAARCSDYGAAFRPYVAPTVMRSRVGVSTPAGASLADRRELSTGATVRVYDVPGESLPHYHLSPAELGLDADATRTLAGAYELLATGGVDGGRRAPARAVRRVADDGEPLELLAKALDKHTRGLGVLSDCFADDRVSDVYATAPVDRNPLRIVVDGETMRSNVRLTARGARGLASRFRRESGRAFSRASPTLDATVAAGDSTVRIAGLTEPASDGVGFAFRAEDEQPWTLPALVENGTVPADAAGLLSVAVRRSAAMLVAGTRGAGKTTTLDALLWELPPETRVVAIEDTPELSVGALQREGRDVQPIRTTSGEASGLTAVEGLRTALRLGEGALVVGEVRGEEAAVLYEAMRVGADGSAVLGTIHGDGAGAVRERVVADLGVPESSFAATDLVVTLDRVRTDDGRRRRLASVEEVVPAEDGVAFEPLFAREDGRLAPTGRIDRGESRLLAALAAPGESYEELRELIDRRASDLRRRARIGATAPEDLTNVDSE
jgi:flagellar protein FlaI